MKATLNYTLPGHGTFKCENTASVRLATKRATLERQANEYNRLRGEALKAIGAIFWVSEDSPAASNVIYIASTVS